MVLVETPESWQKATERARERQIAVRLVERTQVGADVTEYWRASSASQPGTEHGLSLTASAEGVSIKCDCLGAQYGHYCQHQAAVLRAAGLLEPSREEPRTEGPSAEQIKRLKGRRSLALINDDEDVYEALGRELAALGV